MPDSKLAGIAAIVFAVLFVAAALAPGQPPSGTDPDADYVQYYGDSGNQVALLASVYFMAISSIALVVFATVQSRSGTTLASIARATAYLAAAAFALGQVAIASVGAEALISDAPIDPGAARFIPSFGYGAILVVGGLAAAATVAALSTDWKRNGTMPAWLCWFGYAVSVVLLFGVIFIPMASLVLWALAAGIVLLVKKGASVTGRPAAL